MHKDRFLGLTSNFSSSTPYNINLPVFGADLARFWDDLESHLKLSSRFNVLLVFWELDQFPDRFLELGDKVDMVFAPTRFIESSFGRLWPHRPVEYCPHATSSTRSVAEGLSAIPSHVFAFFYNFDICSSVYRKNPFALVKAFRAAFGVREDGRLVLKVSGTKHAAACLVLEALGRAAGKAQYVWSSKPLPTKRC